MTTYLTYFDSAEGITISRKRALIELKKHNIHEDDIAVFLEEVGNFDTYDAQAVLGWLGY
ncbi:hypothetical protein BZY71_14100 [Leclercia adecarboxylata]|uniref:hypothetical protein n=1 Tax=Leclercia adecarboxylata TaxID=83655 RepID=UPI000981A316|nr:hypothetical protein [Leclercia adecarboxylata]OOB86450.1 hypothetical protein BZY71_14100 [Leclercia adecarboxylata]